MTFQGEGFQPVADFLARQACGGEEVYIDVVQLESFPDVHSRIQDDLNNLRRRVVDEVPHEGIVSTLAVILHAALTLYAMEGDEVLNAFIEIGERMQDYGFESPTDPLEEARDLRRTYATTHME